MFCKRHKSNTLYNVTIASQRRFSTSHAVLQQEAFDRVISIMRRHGAVKVTMPLLLSRLDFESGTEVATFMDTGGAVVALPYNLRVREYIFV